MLIDLVCQSNYVSYNVKIAELLGLHEAIYLSELMNINEKAIRKDRLSGESSFIIDRDYIQKRTTITPTEQLKLDVNLKKLGLVRVNEQNENEITLDIPVLINLLSSTSDNIKDLKTIAKKTATAQKTKEDYAKANLKNSLNITNPELYGAYCEWIDAVFAKEHWMSLKAIKCAKQEIDSYTNKDLDMALKILDIAAINGYRDITWAINRYEQDYKIKYMFKPTVQINNNITEADLSEEVF